MRIGWVARRSTVYEKSLVREGKLSWATPEEDEEVVRIPYYELEHSVDDLLERRGE